MTHPLEALAARCEKAEGPDRELDAAIHAALARQAGWDGFPDWVTAENSPTYTASLDPAMTLAPEGWRVAEMKDGIPHEGGPYCQVGLWCPANSFLGYKYRANAATPALALCAAALRAHAAVEGDQ